MRQESCWSPDKRPSLRSKYSLAKVRFPETHLLSPLPQFLVSVPLICSWRELTRCLSSPRRKGVQSYGIDIIGFSQVSESRTHSYRWSGCTSLLLVPFFASSGPGYRRSHGLQRRTHWERVGTESWSCRSPGICTKLTDTSTYVCLLTPRCQSFANRLCQGLWYAGIHYRLCDCLALLLGLVP